MRLLCTLTLILALGCLPRPAEPALRAVEPTSFDANLGTTLALLAEGLVPPATLDFDQPAKSPVPPAVVSAFIEDGPTRVALLDVVWIDSTRVTGRLAGPVPAGLYDVHLFEPRGQELVLPAALQSLDCSAGECPLEDGGTLDSGVVACATLNYRDRDLDGYGSGGARLLCGAGWVPLTGDCDDRDGLAFPDAGELCNGLDDDCNGLVDDGRCADAGWTGVDELRSPANDLLAAAPSGPGSLWIAADQKAFVRRAPLGFVDVSPSCPSNLRSVWAEPGGEAELGGENDGEGRIAEQSASSTSCSNVRQVRDPPVAMVGFPSDAGYQYVAVLEDGRLLRWRRGQAPTVSPSNLDSSDRVIDLHGVSPDRLYAVGSVTVGGNTRRPMSWALQADGGWAEEPLTGQGNPNGRMRGLWMLSAVEGVAVGDDGRVFRRTDTGWRALASDTSSDLTSVRAFSSGRFYLTTAGGEVIRWARESWQVVYRNDAGVPFNDLSGTSEEDLWAVGDDGFIARSPR